MPPPESRLATHPFKLIETPVHAQKATKPYDQYVEAASSMALAHNVFIRGLNSIYLQAPYITPSETPSFISYSLCFYENLNAHHETEENVLFPAIEEKTGEKGIMNLDIEQHHAFLPGLNQYKEYLTIASNDPHKFSGIELNSIIDSFAPILVHHLTEEIPHLLSPSRFGSFLPLLDMVSLEGRKAPLHVSKTRGLPFFVRNVDRGFEDGLWQDWPPIPAPVLFIMQRTFVAWNSSWWRFASSDGQAQLKELPALG